MKFKSLTLIALTLLIFISGCSFLRMGYSLLDWLLYQRIDGYFELDDAQESQVKEQLDQLHQWHRATQLPLYKAYLERMEQAALTGPTRADLAWLFNGYKSLRQNLAKAFVARSGEFLASLKPEQLQHFLKNTAKKNLKLQKGIKDTVETRIDIRTHSIQENFKEWVGELSEAQRKNISQFSHRLPLFAEVHLTNRLSKQQAFIQGLKKAKGNPEASRRVLEQAWVQDYDDADNPYFKVVRQTQAMYQEFIFEFYQGLSLKQKNHLQERITDWKEDVNALIKKN